MTTSRCDVTARGRWYARVIREDSRADGLWQVLMEEAVAPSRAGRVARYVRVERVAWVA